MLKHYSLNRILTLIVAVGFFFLAIDSTMEHWEILLKELMSFVPIVFGVVGGFIGIMTVLRWKEQWIRTFQIILLAAFLVAGTGLYLHIREEDETVQEEQKEKDKPILAPLAFAGMAVVGLAGTLRKWQAETTSS